MPTTPSVSVILPTRNGLPFLSLAVDSILAQSVADLELIIIDNGSSDQTESWIQTVRDPRVVYVKLSEPGIGRALNYGLTFARSQLIARMDADDVSLPNRLELQVRFLNEHPKAVLVGSQFQFFASGRLAKATPLPTEDAKIRHHLSHGSPVLCHPAILFRTTAALSAGGYRTEGVGEELDFFLRMGEFGEIRNTPQILHYYRVSQESVSVASVSALSEAHQYALSCWRMRASGQPEPPLPEFQAYWHRRPAFAKMLTRVDEFGRIARRRSLVHRLWHRRVLSLAWLLVAGVCSPVRAKLHVSRFLDSIRERPDKHEVS